MSWSDDIRCLFCDGRLPLYRKITNGQFCSSAHRKAYWQEQEKLALERLHQTHDTLHAYRKVLPLEIESIIGRMPEPEPQPTAAPAEAEQPSWMALVSLGQLPMAVLVVTPLGTKPRWAQDQIAGANPDPMNYSSSLRRPFNIYQPFDCGFEWAGAVAPLIVAQSGRLKSGALTPLAVMVYPVSRVVAELQPVFEPIEIVSEDIPPFAGVVALARPGWREMVRAIAGVTALEITLRARLPLDQMLLRVALAAAEPLKAGLRQLPMDQIALVQGPWIDHLRALDLRAEPDAPLYTLATPPVRPRLSLATGRRYGVTTRESTPAPLAAEAPAFTPAPAPGISLPQRATRVLRASPSAANETPRTPAAQPTPQEPNPAGLLSLRGMTTARPAPNEMHAAPETFSTPQAPRAEPLRPRARLEPMSPKPAFDLTGDQPIPPLVVSLAEPEIKLERTHVLSHAIDFWHRAPRDLKMLVFAIPLLLGLAMHPALPKVRVAAPARAAAIQRDVQQAWSAELVNVKQTVTERAAIALDEDFRAGLDDWVSRGDATTEWSFDATGFVRPGPLALYRPSLSLTDYQVQFLGMIDKKALSWVARAADFNNYYVIKLVVLKAGPLPTIGVTRYAVVNGKADSRVDRIAPLNAREDMLYRVKLDLHGDDYALTVQDQLVDAWSEPRLTHGGIGFFTARGEDSRLRWVQVTHQYDMLGRLCAYLAPFNFSQVAGISQTTGGSWQQ